MRILFATLNYFPDRGGLQTSIEKLIHWLNLRGHFCSLLVYAKRRDLITPTGLLKGAYGKFLKRPFVFHDKTFSYPVYRTKTPFESLSTLRQTFKPDVLVCVVGGDHTIDFSKMLCMAAGDLPTAIYVFDIQGVAITADNIFANSHLIANAEVIASLIGKNQPKPPIVPCIVDSNECRVDSTREVILYINPHPRKGDKLAWAIAEAAQAHGLKFVFQESWRLKGKHRMEVIGRAQKLENVEFRAVTNRCSEIYRDARVLLAPYGPERPRVVDEAQANGIPVVASDVAGLNESVGPGGVLIDPSGPIDKWISILKRLSSDNDYYEALVSAAFRHSKRPELQPEYLIEIFEHELHRAIEKLKS